MKFIEKIRLFMANRYGPDELTLFVAGVCIVPLFLSIIPPLRLFVLAALAGVAYNMFRMLSKNISARQKEREFYLRKKDAVKTCYNLTKRRFKDRKTHKYFKCDKCKAILRVPKGKGKIEITCPKCGSKLIKKT